MKAIHSTGVVGASIPSFSLPSSTGRTVNSWDNRGRRNLAILLVSKIDNDVCLDTLRSFAQRYADYRDCASDVVAIVQSNAAAAVKLAEALHLPFAVLADENGDVRRRFYGLIDAQETDSAVIVSDKFGQVWAHSSGKNCGDLFSQDVILGWLEFIELQCPE